MATGAIAAVVALMLMQQNRENEAQAHTQRFVDTATQTVVDMFSFKQDSIDDSVDRFYSSTSGPLRDMMSQGTNVENLKAVFRDTGGSSEATVTGAALESFDSVSNNASVLVSVRVTASDQNGNDRPSRAYRMRVVVHQDDNGKMTTYDLKYPNGGN
jgi:Mce-associated membrane protein